MGSFDRFRAKTDAAAITLDQLVAQATAGDRAGALAAADAKVAAVARVAGTTSPKYAEALCDAGLLSHTLGLLPRAIDAMRTAAKISGPRPEDEKNRLTYLMNLGDFLAAAESYDAALEAHEEGLAGREAFYGREHPGYGFGLDSWADTALAVGRFAEARARAGEAHEIYQAAGHERAFRAMAIYVLASHGEGVGVKSFEIAPEGADKMLLQIANRTIAVRADVEYASVELIAAHTRNVDVLRNAWTSVIHGSVEQGDHATRLAALRMLYTMVEGNREERLMLELGLGLANDQSGAKEEAARWYERALVSARDLGIPGELANTLTNAGLFFADTDEPRAIALMREGVKAAPADSEQRARSQVALGIRLQHSNRREEARPLLAAAVARLDRLHPDSVCAASHLRAIEEGAACSCGTPSNELATRVTELVRARVGDCISSVEIVDGAVSVNASRELSEEEVRAISDTIDLARAELRRRSSQLYG